MQLRRGVVCSCLPESTGRASVPGNRTGGGNAGKLTRLLHETPDDETVDEMTLHTDRREQGPLDTPSIAGPAETPIGQAGTPEALSDEQVVARVLAGEPHLFELLIRRYNPRIYRVTRAISRSDADAEDAMQDAYVQAFTNLAGFEGRASFATWLTRIAVHAALGRVRRTKNVTVVEDLDEMHIAPEKHPMSARTMAKSPETHTDHRELRALLETAIDQLPDHYRTVFVLRAVEDLDVSEAAEALALQEETVRTRFFRARAMLRDAFLEQIDDATRNVFEFHLSRCDRVVAAVFARIGLHAPPPSE
jgi:RNA polymerase sigma-70 factor (ECF subfamily)